MTDKAAGLGTEEDLVRCAQAGNHHAFDSLIRIYAPRLYGLIYKMTANREDTDDLLQETFAAAYRALPKFHGKSSFYTWIYQIAANRTLNFLKKHKRTSTISLNGHGEDRDLVYEIIDSSDIANPEKQNKLKELQKRLNKALQELSNKHRVVVILFDIQGMSHAEIAEILKISSGTVRSRLHYAHKQLQQLLQDLW